MKRALILVPILFLLALVYLAYTLYEGTQSNTACRGEECENLTADQLADRAIEAKVR